MIDYTEAIKLHREFGAKIKQLEEEYRQQLIDAYGEETVFKAFGCGSSFVDFLQVYPEKPSINAVFHFETEEAKYYELKVDDYVVSECVRNEDVQRHIAEMYERSRKEGESE